MIVTNDFSITQPHYPPQILNRDDHKNIWVLGRTSIDINKLSQYVDEYPNVSAAQLLKNGYNNGFKLIYTGPPESMYGQIILGLLMSTIMS